MAAQLTSKEQNTINQAQEILARYSKGNVTAFTSVADTKRYFKMQLATKEIECFHVAFLDSQHMLIDEKEMFTGTLASCAVYPREIMKVALELNAAAIILAHNHPSGSVEPSRSDRNITTKISKAAALFDISLLDHIIVGRDRTSSFAELGLV